MIDRIKEDIPKRRSTVIACGARLSLQKWRNTGDPTALQAHKFYKAELRKRGLRQRYGELGWDYKSG